MNKLLLVLWKWSDEWIFFVSDQHKFLFPKMSALVYYLVELIETILTWMDGACTCRTSGSLLTDNDFT